MATTRPPGPHPTMVLAGRRLDSQGVCIAGTTFAWCKHPACDWYDEGAREHVLTAATDHERATSLMDMLETISTPPAPAVRLHLARATRMRDEQGLAIGWEWPCTEPDCTVVVGALDDPEREGTRTMVETMADEHLATEHDGLRHSL